MLNWPNQPFGWWTSINNQKMDYWGDAELGSRRCACALSPIISCANPNTRCNCDSGDEDTENVDSGHIIRKEHLPIIKVNFGDTGSPAVVSYQANSERNVFKTKSAKYTIGPLMCEGDNLYDNAITFRRVDSGIETAFFHDDFVTNYIPNFDPERITIDLRFEFRTATPYGIFLYCNGPTGDFLELKIISKNEISFR